MKHNKNHDNVRGTGPQLVPVRFEFTHPTATTTCVAGTFNDWNAETKPLHPVGDGRWLKETALPPGTYEYCLVVDGEWMPDPQARETAPNPFRREKLDTQGGRLAGSIASCRRRTFTLEKRKPIERTEQYGQTNTSNQQ